MEILTRAEAPRVMTEPYDPAPATTATPAITSKKRKFRISAVDGKRTFSSFVRADGSRS
jgi:hypothetical protein